jgi:hypothetical protein
MVQTERRKFILGLMSFRLPVCTPGGTSRQSNDQFDHVHYLRYRRGIIEVLCY